MAESKTFEESLKELESIASELENGNLSLEDSIKKFEKGMK
jgi:exodeoxyribonuclease VII small subunit